MSSTMRWTSAGGGAVINAMGIATAKFKSMPIEPMPSGEIPHHQPSLVPTEELELKDVPGGEADAAQHADDGAGHVESFPEDPEEDRGEETARGQAEGERHHCGHVIRRPDSKKSRTDPRPRRRRFGRLEVRIVR